mmetsp:Transcript_19925/g.75275  ORF Transcript_19925/g.75275 Transcript_19925/m.75275 type:complete len:884 (-) Transcript_19925:1772-4423(-)
MRRLLRLQPRLVGRRAVRVPPPSIPAIRLPASAEVLRAPLELVELRQHRHVRPHELAVVEVVVVEGILRLEHRSAVLGRRLRRLARSGSAVHQLSILPDTDGHLASVRVLPSRILHHVPHVVASCSSEHLVFFLLRELVERHHLFGGQEDRQPPRVQAEVLRDEAVQVPRLSVRPRPEATAHIGGRRDHLPVHEDLGRAIRASGDVHGLAIDARRDHAMHLLLADDLRTALLVQLHEQAGVARHVDRIVVRSHADQHRVSGCDVQRLQLAGLVHELAVTATGREVQEPALGVLRDGLAEAGMLGRLLPHQLPGLIRRAEDWRPSRAQREVSPGGAEEEDGPTEGTSRDHPAAVRGDVHLGPIAHDLREAGGILRQIDGRAVDAEPDELVVVGRPDLLELPGGKQLDQHARALGQVYGVSLRRDAHKPGVRGRFLELQRRLLQAVVRPAGGEDGVAVAVHADLGAEEVADSSLDACRSRVVEGLDFVGVDEDGPAGLAHVEVWPREAEDVEGLASGTGSHEAVRLLGRRDERAVRLDLLRAVELGGDVDGLAVQSDADHRVVHGRVHEGGVAVRVDANDGAGALGQVEQLSLRTDADQLRIRRIIRQFLGRVLQAVLGVLREERKVPLRVLAHGIAKAEGPGAPQLPRSEVRQLHRGEVLLGKEGRAGRGHAEHRRRQPKHVEGVAILPESGNAQLALLLLDPAAVRPNQRVVPLGKVADVDGLAIRADGNGGVEVPRPNEDGIAFRIDLDNGRGSVQHVDGLPDLVDADQIGAALLIVEELGPQLLVAVLPRIGEEDGPAGGVHPHDVAILGHRGREGGVVPRHARQLSDVLGSHEEGTLVVVKAEEGRRLPEDVHGLLRQRQRWLGLVGDRRRRRHGPGVGF